MVFVGVSTLCKVKRCSGLSIQGRAVWARGRSCDSSHIGHRGAVVPFTEFNHRGVFFFAHWSEIQPCAKCKDCSLLGSDESQCWRFIGEALGGTKGWDKQMGRSRRCLSPCRGVSFALGTHTLSVPSCFSQGKDTASQAVFRNLFQRADADIKLFFFFCSPSAHNKRHHFNLKDFIVLITALHLGVYYATTC